ncbi:MAG: TonB-dependent receptor [Bryobacteraceae bacterium]|nr:TonB-dependent receptor [Bryobacteraceae bacterium]
MWNRLFLGMTLPCLLVAQTQTAQVTGKVSDPSGATVPGAEVTVRNTTTGLSQSATSNDLGNYTIPLLPPGSYRIEVRKEGFKPVRGSGFELQVAQVARLDFTLDVGNVNDTVQVTAEVPLLAQETSSLGQVIDNAKVSNIPLNGRSPYRLLQLTPGVLSSPSASGMFGDIAVNQVDETNFSINGGRYKTNEVMVDGVPSTAGFGNTITTVPTVESTQEFKVQSSNLSAEWGRFGGGVLNVSTKSGTNDLHGSLFEFLRNNAFDANEFFNKGAGRATPAFRMNQFGYALSGPAWLGKLYNGRNRTFFFTDYQGTKWRRGDVFIGSVPTIAERQGDFTRTLNAQGQLITMYDPLSTRPDPNRTGQFLRDPFAGNSIPGARLDPIARRMVEFYPQPNAPGAPFTNQNNFISNQPRAIDQVLYSIRVDHNVNSRERLFGRFGVMRSTLGQPDTYGNPASAGVGANGKVHTNGYSGVLNSLTTLSPTLLFELKYGFARFHWDRPTRSFGFNPATLGFPESLVSQFQVLNFPPTSVEGISGLSGGSFLDTSQDKHSLLASLTRLSGRHSIKMGADLRLMRAGSFDNARPSGNFNFPRLFTRGPDPNLFTANSGSGFASMLLGAANTGSVIIAPSLTVQNFYFGGYLQDDIRLTSRLTLNLGVRYETETPMTERYNQLVRFDAGLASPVRNAQFPALTGGLTFAGPEDRYVYSWDKNNFAPRAGFSYLVLPRTVIRAGAGLFYAPLELAGGGGFTNAPGYSSETPFVGSLDGLRPFRSLSNPYPGGLTQPARNTLGAATFLGQGFSTLAPRPLTPYTAQWNFDLQRELPGGYLVDAAYTGSRGIKLNQARQFNALPPENLPLRTGLQQLVDNPFFGSIPVGALSQPRVARMQLLLPYPQFTAVGSLNEGSANSVYHALNLKVEKRFSSGVGFLLSYTAGKLISDAQNGFQNLGNPLDAGLNSPVQNWYDLRSERAVSEMDVAQTLAFSYVAELPFGKGHRWMAGARGAKEALVGGWQISGVTTYRGGTPLVVTAPGTVVGNRPNSNGASAKIEGSRTRAEQISRWFDTSTLTPPAPFTFGNAGRTLPDVRGPAIKNFDVSLVKNTAIGENIGLQLRLESFNAFNRPHFWLPNTSAGGLQFGRINTTTSLPRVNQIALKLVF